MELPAQEWILKSTMATLLLSPVTELEVCMSGSVLETSKHGVLSVSKLSLPGTCLQGTL